MSRNLVDFEIIVDGKTYFGVNDYILPLPRIRMVPKTKSIFLATIMILSVMTVPQTQADSARDDHDLEDFEDYELTLMSVNDIVIENERSNTLFVQGATIDLKWEFENLPNETNYTFQWRGWDTLNDRNLYGEFSLLFDSSEDFSLGVSTNHTVSWTLEVPADSCVVTVDLDLYLQDTGQYIGWNLVNTWIPICNWAIDFDDDDDEILTQSELNLNGEGLVLVIEKHRGTHWLDIIDYSAGNRDGTLNQSEYNLWLAEEQDDDGTFYDCLYQVDDWEDNNIGVGNTWVINGEEIELNYSSCEWTFDQTGIQVTTTLFFNGSWEADGNGYWILNIYSGTVYGNCTLSTQDVQSEWACLTDDLNNYFYYEQRDGDHENADCDENTNNNTWSCYDDYWDETAEIHDNCISFNEQDPMMGFHNVGYVCTTDGDFLFHQYDSTECQPTVGGHHCKVNEVENIYWRQMDFCQWVNTSLSNDCSDGEDGESPERWLDYCEWSEEELKWYCTNEFGRHINYGNTTGNTHHLDGTTPTEMFVPQMHYGVSGSEGYNLSSGGFTFDNGTLEEFPMSLQSPHLDVPYDWNKVVQVTVVWSNKDVQNETSGNETSANETMDSDGDGVGDNSDAFPYDSNETMDSDGDGVGDNSDAFPYDSNETLDSDGDSFGDNSDMFPYDSSEWQDVDGDGIGDNSQNSDTGDNGNNTDTGDGNNTGTGDGGDNVTDVDDITPSDPTEPGDTVNNGTGDNIDDADDAIAEPITDDDASVPGFTGILATIALLGAIYIRRDE